MKKAQISLSFLHYVPRIFYTIVVVFSIVLLINSFIVSKVDAKEMETELFPNILLYSGDGLSYYDKEIEKVQPFLLDISNLSDVEDRINKKLSFGDPEETLYLGARIKYLFNDVENYKGQKEQVIHFNEQFFDYLEPLQNLKGPGGSYILKKEFDVIFVHNYKHYPGKIIIEVGTLNG